MLSYNCIMLEQEIENWKDDSRFQFECLILDLPEQVIKRMLDLDINRSELAKKMKVSRSWVTHFMHDQQNWTLMTLVKVAIALDMDVKIQLIERKTKQ